MQWPYTGGERYVLLDLGNRFAAGRMVRDGRYMVTLEVYKGKRSFRPAYSTDTIQRILPVNKTIAKLLGPFFLSTDESSQALSQSSLE